MAIAFFFAISTGIGGAVGPGLFGKMIESGDRDQFLIGYLVAADREIEAIVKLLREKGPLGAPTIRRELETRFWGPGRLRAAPGGGAQARLGAANRDADLRGSRRGLVNEPEGENSDGRRLGGFLVQAGDRQ